MSDSLALGRHFTGMILAKIRRCVGAATGGTDDAITVDNLQQNGSYGVHQARVLLKGCPRTYRLILAPDDAPIEIHGRPIGDHFSKPLGAG